MKNDHHLVSSELIHYILGIALRARLVAHSEISQRISTHFIPRFSSSKIPQSIFFGNSSRTIFFPGVSSEIVRVFYREFSLGTSSRDSPEVFRGISTRNSAGSLCVNSFSIFFFWEVSLRIPLGISSGIL